MFATFWKITRFTWDSAKRVLIAQGRGPGQEGNDDAAAGDDEIEVIFPMGLVAQPELIDGLEAICIEMGDDVVALALVNKQLAPFSPAIESGETRTFGAKEQSVMIRHRADGSLELKAKNGQPIRIDCTGAGDVIVNGGTLSVARSSDQVQVTIPSGSLTLAVSGSNATGPATPLTLSGTITGAGAAHFKA
jgi:hypothetical protein